MPAYLAHREIKDVRPGRSPGLHSALLPRLHHKQRQAKLLTCPSLCAKGCLAKPLADLRLQQRIPFMLQSTGNLLDAEQVPKHVTRPCILLMQEWI